MDYNDADDLRKFQADAAEFGPDDAAERERQARAEEDARARLTDLSARVARAEATQHSGEFAVIYPNGNLADVARDGDPRCPAVVPDGNAQCAYPAGHARLTVDGVDYDHHVPRVVSWNEPPAPPLADTADPGYAGRLDELRKRAEESTVTPDAVDAETVLGSMRRAIESGRVKVVTNACDRHPAPPVRARFVDLPPRYSTHSGPFGMPSHVAEPGGFALVVDRFRDRAHRDAERATWEEFGATVGARVAACFAGELDIHGYVSE